MKSYFITGTITRQNQSMSVGNVHWIWENTFTAKVVHLKGEQSFM